METSSFAAKFLSRIQRIDPGQIESFLTHLVREKDLQKAILDSLPEGIFVADSELRIVFLNDAARGLLGLGGRKVQGELVRRVLRAKPLQRIADRFLESHAPVHEEEIRVRTPETRIYTVSVVPIEDERGGLSHSVWIIGDQTDRHRRVAERQRVEGIRSLATLTAGIAHEIKNPLNSLNIHAQLILKAAEEFAARHHEDSESELNRLRHSTGVLLEEIARLTRIVDQFIRAARPVSLSLQSAHPNELLESVARLVGPECQARRIDLVLDLDSEIGRIRMDPEQMQQAILNITKNAMEAIDKPDGRIILRSRFSGDHVLLEIEDNGCGIPEEDRVRIFEPYHTTKEDGSGLGLMVVFRIISAHQGAIGLDSEVGQGTLFKIALPLDEKPIRLLQNQVGPAADQRGDEIRDGDARERMVERISGSDEAESPLQEPVFEGPEQETP